MAIIKMSSKIVRLIRSGVLLFVGVFSLFFLPDIKENIPDTAHADYPSEGCGCIEQPPGDDGSSACTGCAEGSAACGGCDGCGGCVG